jgi:hypothetical protein
MKKDVDYYDRLPWKVEIEPERQEDGTIIYIASHPEFEGVLGSGATPEEALGRLLASGSDSQIDLISQPRPRLRHALLREIIDVAVEQEHRVAIPNVQAPIVLHHGR